MAPKGIFYGRYSRLGAVAIAASMPAIDATLNTKATLRAAINMLAMNSREPVGKMPCTFRHQITRTTRYPIPGIVATRNVLKVPVRSRALRVIIVIVRY